MKRLLLFRHAKTERDSASGRDFDRALTDRGKRDAARMGAEIRKLPKVSQIRSSPALRAGETAGLAGLAGIAGLGELAGSAGLAGSDGLAGTAPLWDERIYGASAGQLLEIVRESDQKADSLLMVGHNPGFEQLASLLADEHLSMPTGSLVQIELAIDHWTDAAPATGRITHFLKPKELD